VLLLAAVAGIALVVAEFSTLIRIDVATGSCKLIEETNPTLADRCITTGAEHHGFALVAVGVLVLAMGWGAAVGASRPAAGALIVAALVTIGIWLFADLPNIHDEGLIGRDYDKAKASPGIAFWLELGAAVAAFVAGALALTLRPGRRAS
jgi:hypothetical protein